MLDCGGDQRSYISGRLGTEKTPPKTGKKNEPRKEGSHDPPDEAWDHVIAWHRKTEAEENGGIGKRQGTTDDVVTDQADGLFVLESIGLSYVLVYKLSMEDAQRPSTDGRTSSSATPGNLQFACNPSNDVHHDGADQPAQQSPVEYFHEIPPS